MAKDDKTLYESQTAAGGDPFARGSLLLNTYRIESEPIRGGMGAVWRVHHTGWNTDLAMKRPQPQMFASEVSKRNFVNECQSWIDLGLHPNIVSCYYVREIGGVPTIFSEWMENGSLESHIEKGTLYGGTEAEQQARLLDIALQFARGLHYAHESGLIHQDVKPDNLLLTRDWQAKVADFGLANALGSLTVQEDPAGGGATRMAASGGYTPAYCSMEQMDGKVLTRRTDIYSWAVSVMEMYLGSRPWVNGVVAGMSCRGYFEDCRVNMPEALRELLARCMETDPDARPHDFGVIERKLKEIYLSVVGEDYPRLEPKAAYDTADSLNNRALSYLDLGMPREAERLWQRARFADPYNIQTAFNSTLYALRQGKIAPGEAQAGVGMAFAEHPHVYEYYARINLEIGPAAYPAARKAAQAAEQKGQGAALKEEVENAIRQGKYTCQYVLSRIQSLPEIDQKEQKYDRKARELRALIAEHHDSEAAIQMAGLLREDGDFINCVYRPEWIALNDSLGHRGFPVGVKAWFPLMKVEDVGYEDHISFSDDSSLFLSGGRLYDMRTGELLADHRPKGVKAVFSKLSPDGTFLLRGRRDEKGFDKIDARTGEVLERFEGFREYLSSLAISPDGTAVAGCDESGEFRFWVKGEQKFLFRSKLDPIRHIFISGDNRQILFSLWNYGSVFLADVANGGKVEQLDFRFRTLIDVSVNTPFSLLVASGVDEGYIVYDLRQRKIILQESRRNVQERIKNVYAAGFLPNDQFFAYVSTNEIWYYATQLKTFFGLFALGEEIGSFGFSRNWQYMTVNGDHSAQVFHVVHTWYVPPSEEEDGNRDRFRFAKAFLSKGSNRADDTDCSRYGRRLLDYEAVYSDLSVLPAYARILHAAHPDMSSQALLSHLMRELSDRGYGALGEATARKLLEDACPPDKKNLPPPSAFDLNQLLSGLEQRAKEQLGKDNPEKTKAQPEGKRASDPVKADPADAGKTVYDPHAGKTVADPGKTVIDPGITVTDAGKTVMDPGKTAMDPGKTAMDARATVPVQPEPLPEPVQEQPDNSFEKGALLLDTYRIESDAIKGGMGAVWRVHHTGWNTDLAMKRPQPQMFADETAKENFINECQSWIDLGLHPNIVSCYYVREIGGVPTIFSEWMENGSLENHIEKGTLYEGAEQEQQERLLDIAIQYARGLHYAHESGLIHQDVKPDNLLLTKDWQAKAADFGLAKARGVLTVQEGPANDGATHVAASGGYTPAYCSMEQMDGKVLTRRTDIYSWAVSVMEMYLGSRPWQNGVVAGMSCRGYFDDCRVRMPEALRELLARCMETDPDARPHDFAIIEEKLREIYRAEIGSAYPRPAPKAAADTAESLNNRALTYLDLGLPQKAEACWAQALEKEPDHPASVYNQGLYLWREGQLGHEELLRRCDSVLRDDPGERDRLQALIRAEQQEAAPREICEMADNDGKRAPTNNYYNASQYAAVSPDGQWIYVYMSCVLTCYDAHTREVRWENRKASPNTIKNPYANFLLLTPDGKYLLYGAGYENVVWVADAATGQVVRTLKGHGRGSVTEACTHPDGRHAYTAGEDRTVRKWDLDTGVCEKVYDAIVPGVRGWLKALCVSPDGARLYAASTREGIAVWDEAGGEQLPAIAGEFSAASLAFSPDGKTLYIGGSQGGFLCDAAKGTVVRPENLSMLSVLWPTPDGRYLLGADTNYVVRVWETGGFQCVRSFQGHKREIKSLTATPDLSLIVTGSVDKAVFAWSMAAPERRAPWELSRARSWKEQMSRQQEIERLQNDIETRIRQHALEEAAALLEQGEERYEAHVFLPLRRKLAGLCASGGVTDVYEMATFEGADYTGDPWNHTYIPAADPRGGAFACTHFTKRKIYLFTETGQRKACIEVPKDGYGAGTLCYSPSGRLLAAGCISSALIVDTDRAAARHFLTEFPMEPGESFVQAAFSPDDRLLLTGASEGFLGLWDTAGGNLVRKFSPGSGRITGVDFIDGGSKAVATDENGYLLVNDVASGKRIKRIKAAEMFISFLTLSPDGRYLYLNVDGEKITVWDTQRWTACGELLPGDKESYEDAQISPDGTLLATAWRGTVKLWSLPDKKLLREITDLRFRFTRNLAFSPDGCILCVGTGVFMHMLVLRRALRAPGNTVPDPMNKTLPAPADAGKTVIEQPDPGKTVMEPKDAGKTAADAGRTIADIGKTIADAGKTIVDPGKTIADAGDTVPVQPEPLPEPPREQPDNSFEKGALLLETYRIESDPICGGMGAVWRVHHTGWNTDLAMKRPQPQMFADEEAKANFINECQSWIDLGLHPNIVSCYYVRELEGVPTIFSEWMENGSLENHIEKGTLYEGTEQEQQARLLDIAIQYARGLHYAHERGLIHQDVKPDNLLLTKDWQAKAADFGLAKARGVLTVREEPEDAGATRATGKNIYTPAYCSMEQMDGKVLTRATDIYSWAVSVMEMYLGARPWANGVVAGMSCRGYFDDCRVNMPEALRDLLARCMETDPDARPHDFGVIEEELKTIYLDALGEEYTRSEPEAAADTADSLNNRALSYLDLGMPQKAEAYWQEALEKEPDSVLALYNRELYRLRSDPKTNRDGYTMQNGMGRLFSDLLQRDNGMPTARSGELLANLYVADHYGALAEEHLRQAIAASAAGSPERKAFEARLRRMTAAWMKLPIETEHCGFIAFDAAEDRCAVAWQREEGDGSKAARLAIYDIPSRHEINSLTMDAAFYADHQLQRVILCREAIYLCGPEGYSFAAFDPDTLERLPAYDRCDFTRREDIKEWPTVKTADGLRRLTGDANVQWKKERGRPFAWDEEASLWRPRKAEKPQRGGINIKPSSSARRNRMEAALPAMGLSEDSYAISTDSGHRWLLTYTQPYYVSQERYFAIYDLSLFGFVPDYVVARASSYAEVAGRQNEMKRLLAGAEKCLQEKNLKGALELLDEAYALDPDHPSEEWSRINNAVGRQLGCQRKALRGSRNIGVLSADELPTAPRDPGGYNMADALPGGSMMLMMALAAGGLPYGFFTVDRCPDHLVFERQGDCWIGRLTEGGRIAARLPGDMLLPGAIGILGKKWGPKGAEKSLVYACSAGMLSAWDTGETPLAFRGAVRFGRAVPPGASRDQAFINSLPPLNPTGSGEDWALEPYLLSLNRPVNATVALVQSHVLNRLGPEKIDGLCAVSVIDLRTMQLLHTMFVHSKRRLEKYGCSHNIGMDMLMDISPEGDLFLWHTPSSIPFLWMIPTEGEFLEIPLGSTGADRLRMDGTAYIGMASFGPQGEKYKQVVLDWQYGLPDPRVRSTGGLNEKAYRAALLPASAPKPTNGMQERPPEKKSADPMADLLAGLEKQAQGRMNDKPPETKPPQGRPADPMADLLAGLERQAQNRMKDKPPEKKPPEKKPADPMADLLAEMERRAKERMDQKPKE